MKADVCSVKEVYKLIEGGFPNNTAVISIFSPKETKAYEPADFIYAVYRYYPNQPVYSKIYDVLCAK